MREPYARLRTPISRTQDVHPQQGRWASPALNDTVLPLAELFTSKVVIPNHFFDSECWELLDKIRVKVGRLCEHAQSFDLSFLPNWICRGQLKPRL